MSDLQAVRSNPPPQALAGPERSLVHAREDWWGEVWAVLVKDARSELRTKSALSSILLFSLTTLVLISFTVNLEGKGMTIDLTDAGLKAGVHTALRAQLLSTLFWVILYFSAMAGLPRIFVKEEEMGTAAALRLAARPSAVLAGKLVFNLALLEFVSLTTLPLFLLFFRPQVHNWALLVGVVLVGSAAMAGTATLLGAIVARASNRGYLMLVLGFGPLLPVLAFAINGTTAAIYGPIGNNPPSAVSYLLVMGLYVAVMVTVSGVLFERVWGD